MNERHVKLPSWHRDIQKHFEQFPMAGRSIADMLIIIEAERDDLSDSLSQAISQNFRIKQINGRDSFIKNVIEDLNESEHWGGGFGETDGIGEAKQQWYTKALDEILSRLSELSDYEDNVYNKLFYEACDDFVYQHEWSRPEFELICAMPSWTLEEATATLLGVRHERVAKLSIWELPDTSPLRQRYAHLYERLLRSSSDIASLTPNHLSPPKIIIWAKLKGIRLRHDLLETVGKYNIEENVQDHRPTYEQIAQENELLKIRLKEAHKSRTNVLYTLVLGLLAKGYIDHSKLKGDEFDPHAYRITKIRGVIDESGLSIDEDTIRSVIRDAKNHVKRPQAKGIGVKPKVGS